MFSVINVWFPYTTSLETPVHYETVDILCLDLIKGGISNTGTGRLDRVNNVVILSVKDETRRSVEHWTRALMALG